MLLSDVINRTARNRSHVNVISDEVVQVSMITLIGTGHIFNISEPIMFFIKQIWPDAVLVELDVSRFNAMAAEQKAKEDGKEPVAHADKKETPWIYRNTANYQKKMAEGYGSSVGNEMLTAVNTGRLVGAEIGFIDSNAENVMNDIWKEMPFREKTRYSLSTVKDRISGKKEAEKTVEDFSKNEEEMMNDMRRRYPTLMRKLIDERNEHMSQEILRYAEKYNNMVVVVGDAHVEGLCKLLGDREIRKIRLGDILDKDKLDAIRAELWNREVGENES